jgi:hypothetical protein
MGRLHHGTAQQTRRPSPVPATPKTILGSKLVIDLNSDLGITGIGGSMKWADQGPLANDVVQATTANQPALVLNVLNGHAALRMTTAVRQFLARTGSFAGISPGDFPRYYVIGSFTSIGGGGLFELGAGSGNAVAFPYPVSGLIRSTYANGNVANQFRTAALQYTDALPVVAALWDLQANGVAGVSGVATFSKNNVLQATTTGQSTFFTDLLNTIVVCSRYLTNSDGDMFRLVIVNPAPTVAEHNALIAYFRSIYPSLNVSGLGLPPVLASTPTLAQINGASLVYDLNSDVGVTSAAGLVSAWADSSGHSPSGGVTQATSGQQPLVIANALDGHAAIRFDGVDDCLDNASGIVGIPAGAVPYVYCVWAPKSTSPLYLANVYSFGNGGGTQVHNISLWHYTDGSLNATVDSATAGLAVEAGSSARVNTVRLTAAALQFDLANVQVGTVAPTAVGVQNAQTQVRIGKRWDNAFPANIDVLRLAVVNPPPSAAQHAANMEYFRRTYPSAGLGDPYQAILGGLLVEKWDSRQNVYAPGGNVMAWKGTEKGYALQPPTAAQAPALAVDTGFFNSVPVIQCAKTGTKCLVNAALPAPLFAAGTRPCLIVVGRYRTQSGTQVLIDVRGSDSGSATYSMLTTGVVISPTIDGIAISGTAYTATTASSFALYETTAGVATHARDGVVISVGGSGGSVNTDKTKIGIGSQFDGVFPADVSIAMVIACSSIPSPAQLNALAAQIRTDWATQDTVPSILGTVLADYWDSQLSVATASGAVTSWTSQVLNIPLSPAGVPNRPSYAADGTLFNSKSVVQAVTASLKCLFSATLATPLFTTGSKPWAGCVGRFRSYPAATQWAFRTTDASPSVNGPTAFQSGGTLLRGPNASQTFSDTVSAHRILNYFDSAGVEHLTIDGTDATAGTGLSVTANINRVGIGCNVTGANVSDFDCAQLILCFSQPTTAQMTALNALLAASYNV